jgi:hypothetical protein
MTKEKLIDAINSINERKLIFFGEIKAKNHLGDTITIVIEDNGDYHFRLE